MKARLSLEKRGSIFAHAIGYSMDGTLTELLNKLYKRVKEKKESLISNKKGAERYYGE